MKLKAIRGVVADCFVVCGAVAALVGLWLASPVLALIVGGVVAVGVGWAMR